MNELKSPISPIQTFEENYSIINVEIAKRKSKWNLSSIAWMDFEDVSQIIRVHIFEKWKQYDQSKPLLPWLNTCITNQLKNLIRNNYGNYTRPCLKCKASEGSESCRIYTTQCETCPAFREWARTRKQAYQIKLPESTENHQNEMGDMSEDGFDLESSVKQVHEKMQSILKPVEYQVYLALFINNESEADVAKKLGYITTEKNRWPGYKQIKNLRKQIIIKAKRAIEKGTIDLVF